MSQSPLTPPSASLALGEIADVGSPQAPTGPAGGFLRGVWRLVTTNRKVAIGSCIVGIFVLVAIFGPIFIRADPLHYTSNLLASPTSAHLLGTNQAGQDVFTQLVVGTRASVFWAFATGFLVLVIAIAVGLVAGYAGGIVDDLLSLLTNVFLVLPAFPLAVLAVEFFSRNALTIAIIVALTNWPWGARVLRAQTLSLRNREFVTAARASGERPWRIVFLDIFPNVLSIVAASFITTTIQVLLAVAGLEFLGFGDSAAVSWGTMLYDASNSSALLSGAWWWFAPPGLCIALLGCGLALLNFGIDEVADPRLRQSRRRRVVRQGARADLFGRRKAKLSQPVQAERVSV